jgi:hypothetical protein
MDVAVEDADARLGIALRLPHLDVHRVLLQKRRPAERMGGLARPPNRVTSSS